MKRLRIWINSLTLLQQFLSILFIVITFFLMYFLTFLPRNIDTFVNQQMYQQIHNSQLNYISDSIINIPSPEEIETDVNHYVYSHISNRFLNAVEEGSTVDETLEYIIQRGYSGEVYDGHFENDEETVVYSVRDINKDFTLVSIIKSDYRSAFKTALIDSTINTTMLMVIGLYTFLLIWVVSIITPLNSIRNYIDRIRRGEKVGLYIDRKDEIGELAEALVDMNDELSKQQRIREEMIQNISHDLKTPIATIKSYSESIKDGIYPYDTLEKSVDVILEHADRLEKKVYSLITFNKMGYLIDDLAHGDNLAMVPVIQKAILACNVLRGDIVIETNLEDIYFHGEEDPWRIVVENLLDNALRYAKTVVRITLNEDGLSIFNDGELMEQSRIEKLFKPYEKGNKGRFGLGLSIVKKVTETYGYLVAGENMNDGVVFRVIKPKVKKTKKQSAKQR